MGIAGPLKTNNSLPTGKLSIRTLAKLRLLEPVPLEERAPATEGQIVQATTMSGAVNQSDRITAFLYMEMESADKPLFNHFPCLLQPDGSPWALGNIYLLELASSRVPTNPSTLEKIAKALQNFVSIMIELDLDFWEFPKRKSNRPTYAYSNYYRDIVKEFPKKGRESNAKILKIIAFYKWLQHHRGLAPQQSMWKETTGYIRIKNRFGAYYEKQVTRTDLTIRVIKALGEKALRAYDEDEQKTLFEALFQIDNTEMTLGFLLAITTGARLQTVFTLQANALDDYNGSDYHPVVVGELGFADSKYQKRFAILIPGWLVRALQTYLASERYSARKAKSFYLDTQSTYIFLAKTGTPYYAKGNDSFSGDYRTRRIGKSVQAFISQQLNPALARAGHTFRVRFHNLRASFSENVVVDNLDRLNAGEITWSELLKIVSERLAHSSTEETDNYISSVRKKKLMAIAQSKFESYLELKINNITRFHNG